ncbi:hypothetical protein [Rhodococcus maanshanensis]|uniref:Uncharacterized protein n=1 Tax=Rhodococcus maanshanensis TaxID=183556 RepID=A0A1H7RKK9_9NOCA|nr:hypothetical protein [Rhodococcus maanshanensis]SEL60761.1 hypothetical protein SAMN05444583_111137 [Rhodococcus maanshanensis]
MPRSLLWSHLLLLLCASLLMGAGLTAALSDEATGPRPLPDGWFLALSLIALLTGLLMMGTEWLSGLGWPPRVAVVAGLAATAIAYKTDSLSSVAVVLWFVQWAAVAYWFYRLAFDARADR